LFEQDHDLSTFSKYLSIKDAIYEVAHACNGVKDLNIKRGFSNVKTLEGEIENTDLIIEEELNSSALRTIVRQNENFKNVKENEIDEWIKCDGDDKGYQRRAKRT
jgi:hypothetical protein